MGPPLAFVEESRDKTERERDKFVRKRVITAAHAQWPKMGTAAAAADK